MGFTLFNYYQRLNPFNSNQGKKREREEEQNGERRGMLIGMLPHDRRRKRESNREEDCEREEVFHQSSNKWGREGGGISVKEDGAVKKERKIARWSSSQASFLMPHSTIDWHHLDLWTEVAKHMGPRELVIVSLLSRWFNSLFTEGYIWKYAFLRDMNIPVGCHVSFPWKEIYLSAFNWRRIGSFYLDSPFVLLTRILPLPSWLPRPGTDFKPSIEHFSVCSLNNARTGIWIADHHVVRCPCDSKCRGLVHVLDARHVELFLEKGYKNGTWQYEDIGYERIPAHCDVAMGGIFDLTSLWCPTTSEILNANSWAGPPTAQIFKAMIGSHAVAASSNLAQNNGILVRFQVMKDNNGTVVSIRISQHLM